MRSTNSRTSYSAVCCNACVITTIVVDAVVVAMTGDVERCSAVVPCNIFAGMVSSQDMTEFATFFWITVSS